MSTLALLPQKPSAAFYDQSSGPQRCPGREVCEFTDGFKVDLPSAKLDAILAKYPQIREGHSGEADAAVPTEANLTEFLEPAPTLDREEKQVVVLKISSLQWRILCNLHKKEVGGPSFVQLFGKIDREALLEPNLMEIINELFELIGKQCPCFTNSFFCEIWFESLDQAQVVISNYGQNCDTQEREPTFEELPKLVKQAKICLEFESLYGSRDKANTVLELYRTIHLEKKKNRFEQELLKAKIAKGTPLNEFYQQRMAALLQAYECLSKSEEKLLLGLIPSRVFQHFSSYPHTDLHSVVNDWVFQQMEVHEETLQTALENEGYGLEDIGANTLRAIFHDRITMHYDLCCDDARLDLYHVSQRSVSSTSRAYFVSSLLEAELVSGKAMENAIREFLVHKVGIEAANLPTRLLEPPRGEEEVVISRETHSANMKSPNTLTLYESVMLERAILEHNRVGKSEVVIELDYRYTRNQDEFEYYFDVGIGLPFLPGQKQYQFTAGVNRDSLDLTIADGTLLKVFVDEVARISCATPASTDDDSQKQRLVLVQPLLDQAQAVLVH